MEPQVKEDILSVIAQALELLHDGDHHALSELSNHVIHDASIFQDEDSLSTAVLIYALSKVAQRCCEQGISLAEPTVLLRDAYDALNKDNYEDYRAIVKKIFTSIRKIDTRMSMFIEEVIQKSKIKKGSVLYQHGISIGRTAELLGITQWELLQYIGITQTTQVEGELPTKKRLEFARELFA